MIPEFKNIITNNLEGLIMANKPANTKQKQWLSDIAEWAQDNISKIYGAEFDGCAIQLHHVLGRSAKHNKIAIGHEFVIPVPYALHDVNSNHEDNVTRHKHTFTAKFGLQSVIFEMMFINMESQGYDVPSSEILYSIMDTRK